MRVSAVLFIALPALAQEYSTPTGMKAAFRSMRTGNHVVAWAEGSIAFLRAGANHPDDRTQMEIVDGGRGSVAVRAVALNRYWAVGDAATGSRIFCADSVLGERALFQWTKNPDGTFSLRSKSTGKFVAVFDDDTLMTPRPDTMLLRKLAASKNAAGAAQGSAPILPGTAVKPYLWKRSILKAIAGEHDSATKFEAVLPALKKGSAVPRAGKVITFLDSISGKRTICGIHNREPNSNPTQWTNWINNQTGKFPGLWSGDFLFSSSDISSRATMVNEAANQWRLGAAVSLMYHMCPPTGGESCGWNGGILSALSDPQWTQLITNGTPLNATFKQRLRNIGSYLQTLKNGGVEVLFRPFHEMNQGAFWWGGRTGPNGTARLYQITHDFLLDTLGLTNLYFVWSIQDLDYNFQAYNPGDAYWEVFSMDMYNGDGYTAQKYNAMLDVAGPKLIAIAEGAKIPSSTELRAQPRWTYFCGWSELVQSSNTQSQILDSYTAVNTLSRDEMPGWNNVTRIASQEGFRSLNRGRLTIRRLDFEFEISVLGRVLGKRWLPE